MAGRLNPKQIRAKKVADSVRKAMKSGGKDKPKKVMDDSHTITERAEPDAEENARRLRENAAERVNEAYRRAINP